MVEERAANEVLWVVCRERAEIPVWRRMTAEQGTYTVYVPQKVRYAGRLSGEKLELATNADVR